VYPRAARGHIEFSAAVDRSRHLPVDRGFSSMMNALMPTLTAVARFSTWAVVVTARGATLSK